jgi:hypothetical protein
MVDIILAEHGGQAWLVSGERFIDDLLANTLPSHVTIEFVTCESESDFAALRSRVFLEDVEGSQPWLIHPAIARRVRSSLAGPEPSGHRVAFGAWSAARDKEADAAITAAAHAAMTDHRSVVLTSYVFPGGPKPMADLAALRSSLIEAELIRIGVDPTRIAHVCQNSETDAAVDHIDITLVAA